MRRFFVCGCSSCSFLFLLYFSDLATAATSAAGRETSTVVIFFFYPTDQPFGLFAKKANSLPTFTPYSMAALVLNWLIEDIYTGGLLLRIVFWDVESMVQLKFQRNSVIMTIFSLCVVGFSLYHMFYHGDTNNTCLTAMELGGSSLSLDIGMRVMCNAISLP